MLIASFSIKSSNILFFVVSFYVIFISFRFKFDRVHLFGSLAVILLSLWVWSMYGSQVVHHEGKKLVREWSVGCQMLRQAIFYLHQCASFLNDYIYLDNSVKDSCVHSKFSHLNKQKNKKTDHIMDGIEYDETVDSAKNVKISEDVLNVEQVRKPLNNVEVHHLENSIIGTTEHQWFAFDGRHDFNFTPLYTVLFDLVNDASWILENILDKIERDKDEKMDHSNDSLLNDCETLPPLSNYKDTLESILALRQSMDSLLQQSNYIDTNSLQSTSENRKSSDFVDDGVDSMVPENQSDVKPIHMKKSVRFSDITTVEYTRPFATEAQRSLLFYSEHEIDQLCDEYFNNLE